MTRRVDLLIIGQGIAGTTLAWLAMGRGLDVLVVDKEQSNTPSRIAAGLVTPISGQRLTLSHRFHEFWAIADRFYREIESKLGSSFWHVQSSIRLWRNEDERDRYESVCVEKHREYLKSTFSSYHDDALAGEFGGFEMFPSARLDVGRYLRDSRELWESSNCLLNDEIRSSDIEYQPGCRFRIARLGIEANHIAFCTGLVNDFSDSLLPQLRLRPNQGDILTVKAEKLNEDRAVHAGVWLVRQSGSMYLAGATNRWTDFAEQPRAKEREELTSRLQSLILCPFDVVDHRTAVRPASHDQRPLIGVTGASNQIAILNGLGSKGSLQAPGCAKYVLQAMLNSSPVPPDLDWSRT
jgi:glycine oxidase